MSPPILDLCDRLALCYREIEGINNAFSSPPTLPLTAGNQPTAVIRVGALTVENLKTFGLVELTRNFIGRIYIAPVPQGEDAPMNSAGATIGAQYYRLAIPFLDRVHVYFALHPKLDTDAGLDPLSGVKLITTPTDSGIVQRIAPGGAPYWAIDFNHSIVTVMETCTALS